MAITHGSRLGLLFSDGSLNVLPSTAGMDQARREACECDEGEKDLAHLTKIVRVEIAISEEIETPALAPAA